MAFMHSQADGWDFFFSTCFAPHKSLGMIHRSITSNQRAKTRETPFNFSEQEIQASTLCRKGISHTFLGLATANSGTLSRKGNIWAI